MTDNRSQFPIIRTTDGSRGKQRDTRKVLHLKTRRAAKETLSPDSGHSNSRSEQQLERGIALHHRRSRLATQSADAITAANAVTDMRKQFFFASAAADRDFFALR